MKIYILTITDLRDYGYQCKDVEVFTDEPSATERMTELYLNAFKECYGDSDADPFEENVMDYQLTGRYAYVFGEYYFDIFEKEV